MTGMFENYLKTTFRNFWRYRGYTAINLFGLAVGLATCIVIFTYISYELSYDRFHENSEDVYRVAVKGRFAEDFFNVAVSMPPLAANMKEVFPEVRSFTRINKADENEFFSVDDRRFYASGLYFADSAFFDVFTFDMVRGDPARALTEPYTLVITESVAKTYFPGEDPMGRVIRLNDEISMKVTGIIRDIPPNCHLKFTMLGSYATLTRQAERNFSDNNWGSLFLHSYIRLNPGADAGALGEKMRTLIRDAFGEMASQYDIEMIPYLQRVTDIHLRSNLMAELEPNSSITYIYIFSAVAAFILVIACINFMNLSTARSSRRSREVGMRKVSGATREQLTWQFIGESVILSFLALVIATVMVEIFLPVFSNMTGLMLEPYFHQPATLAIALALALAVGFLAGLYPALILSSFQPIRAIKGDLYQGMKRSMLRNLLVVLQFTISITLMVSTWLIYKQMQYINHKNLGYDQENLVIIPLKGERLQAQGETLRNAFAAIPAVKTVSLTASIPGRSLNGMGYIPEGIDSKSPWIIYTLYADERFTEAMGMKIAEGRGFSGEFGSDSMATLINRTLVNKLGWNDPVGRKIFHFGDDDGDTARRTYHIIGVLEDYHFKSLHDMIEPSMILLNREKPGFLAVRLFPGDIRENIARLAAQWEEMEDAFPFDYFFMEEEYKDLYRSEQKMAQLFVSFTVLAMLIACLGLFGLALFSIEQRTKEIGIRKILGASVGGLLYRLSKEFSRWVLMSSVIAWPVAYLLVDNWLQSFAYRIAIADHLWIFAVSALIALAIALLTVLHHAYRAATRDPVESVKYE